MKPCLGRANVVKCGLSDGIVSISSLIKLKKDEDAWKYCNTPLESSPNLDT
jgi:hypothetical protein